MSPRLTSSSRRLSFLNKLSLTGPVWLASDIHLGPDNPKTSSAFFDFLANARQQAQALILLGDIFNAWIGDDWIDDPPCWLSEALASLKQTGQTMPLFLMPGNRDFLMGKRLVGILQATLLDSPTILELTSSPESTVTGQDRYLLAHGDEFCTLDHQYQRFRAIVRNKSIQSLFLALPLSVRSRIANRARQASLQTVRPIHDPRYDVQDDAIISLLQKHGLHDCIHGHTHKPGKFQLGKPMQTQSGNIAQGWQRWVLPDWECDHPSQPGQQRRGGWIILEHGRPPQPMSI